jgi:glycopeptide antibiotics resistance protein
VHNRVDSATNLLIPDHYFVLREQFLERPWDEFRPDRNYWKDVAINILGFIPLGFCFRALFSAMGKDKRASWLAVGLGFAVSLTIEVLQAFLPTRDSGMTDLFTNTLGTGLGVILCVWSVRLHWFSRPAISSRL